MARDQLIGTGKTLHPMERHKKIQKQRLKHRHKHPQDKKAVVDQQAPTKKWKQFISKGEKKPDKEVVEENDLDRDYERLKTRKKQELDLKLNGVNIPGFGKSQFRNSFAKVRGTVPIKANTRDQVNPKQASQLPQSLRDLIGTKQQLFRILQIKNAKRREANRQLIMIKENKMQQNEQENVPQQPDKEQFQQAKPRQTHSDQNMADGEGLVEQPTHPLRRRFKPRVMQ